jgi:predicted nucleotidyltransferase
MRIAKKQLAFLKQEVKKYAPEAKLYLFGSRLNDKKRGGDIDIMILTKEAFPLEQKWEVKIKFYEKFGDQKIDVVTFTFDDQDNFKKLVLLEGIEI